MAWYGAHVVMSVRFKDGIQTIFPAWENIYLIEAADSKEAEGKAARLGREHEGDSSGTFHWNNRPAAWKFSGVRKVIEISNAHSQRDVPGDGTEVTYQTLEFDSEKALQSYATGNSTTMKALD